MPAQLRSAVKFLGRHHAEVLGPAGLIVGVVGTLDVAMGSVAGALALGLYGVARIGARIQARDRGAQAEAVLADVRHLARLDAALFDLARAVGVRSPWRISLYETAEGNWRRLARASDNHEYRNSGRESLPSDCGVLTWASRTGGFNDFLLLPDPETERDAFVAFHMGRNVTAEQVAHLKMPSRSYVGVTSTVIVDEMPADIGIVFESVHPDGVVPALIQRAATPQLLSLLHRLSRITPRLAALDATAPN